MPATRFRHSNRCHPDRSAAPFAALSGGIPATPSPHHNPPFNFQLLAVNLELSASSVPSASSVVNLLNPHATGVAAFWHPGKSLFAFTFNF